MRFEHLVPIDDPPTPRTTGITRRHVWNALRVRAEDPTGFVPALERCLIDRRESFPDGRERLHRSLDFGAFVVSDRVTLEAPDAVVIDTRAGPTWPASRLTIRIEQPKPETLFLRFVYESDDNAGVESDALTGALRRRAYEAADLDMVARIRQLVDDGTLGN